MEEETMVSEEFREKVRLYLNRLREQGSTNMLGAGPYLQKQFHVSPEKARELLIYWIENFRS